MRLMNSSKNKLNSKKKTDFLSIAKCTLNLQLKLKRKISKPIYLKDNVPSFSKKKKKKKRKKEKKEKKKKMMSLVYG